MVAGQGIVRPDPSKVDAIRAWPRPAKLEDVERFLATTSWLRQHLGPRYTDITAPLRVVLKGLHEKRSQGYRGRKVAKGSTPSGGHESDPWPEFWNSVCEQSFHDVKALVIGATELVVPDYEGAASGQNPFILMLDACAYGIGAGLFQGSPDSTLQGSHYSTLGVPS